MKKNWIQYGLVLFSLMFMACEKVIEVPLNEADREIVIEAVAKNVEGESFVKISKSGSVYDDGGFEKMSGAIVTITDKDGNETLFPEDVLEPGKYVAPLFTAVPDNEYLLSVSVDGGVYTASGVSKSVPELDSLSSLMNVGGFGGFGDDTTYLVFYHFGDNDAEKNYYRIKAWVNNDPDENYYLTDDKLFNGQSTLAPIFGAEVKSKDTVLIELLSMDEDAYLYLSTLASTLSGGGPFAPAPANPVSNLSDGLGYFGVFMSDTLSIVVP